MEEGGIGHEQDAAGRHQRLSSLLALQSCTVVVELGSVLGSTQNKSVNGLSPLTNI